MLASTEWLAERLEDPSIAVIDMRWREGGSGPALYEQGHIPGAHHVDWSTDLADPASPIAFMLAGPERFAEVMARCGVGHDTTVVAYADRFGNGPFRLWWGSGVYGHRDVRVLDGGFEKWMAEGRPVSTAPPPVRVPEAPWRPGSDGRPVAGASNVLAARDDPALRVLDSRPADQFTGLAVWFETGPVPAGPDGIAHTPRGALRAGHVPWARSIPWSELYREDFTMKSPEELRELFARAGAEPGTRLIAYCGCGISASALLFAATLAGFDDAVLYDASWEEWGRDPDLPVSRG